MRDDEADIDKLAAPLAVVPPVVEVAPSVEALRFLDRLFPVVVYPAALLVVVMAARPLAAGLVVLGFVAVNVAASLLSRRSDAARVAELLRYAGFTAVLLTLPGFAGADSPSWLLGLAVACTAPISLPGRPAAFAGVLLVAAATAGGLLLAAAGVVPVISAVAAILVCGVLMTAIVGHLDSGGAALRSTLARLEREMSERQRAEQQLRDTRDDLELRVEERTIALTKTNRKLEKEVRDRRDAETHALEANKIKSAFLANMSHELRTPLNAIIGYSDMLLEDAEARGDGEQVADLRKIGVAGVHLLELISSILDLTKIEAGRMELWPERFSARALVQGVTAALETLAEKRGDRIELRIPREVGFMHTDMLKLRQVLFNLIGNAIKFTEHGTIRVGVRRLEIEAREFVEITVADSGIGIAPEALPRLFAEFTQADASTTRRYGGAGLGLSIAREFCRLMGGEITATSVPGEGSTFTVCVPAELPPHATRHATPTAEAERPLLVIDDDPSTHEQIQRALQDEALTVICCRDAAQGLAIAHSVRPQAIVLGVAVAGSDSWDMLAEIRGEVGLRSVPVIVASLLDEQARALDLGASGYVGKPIDREMLLAVLTGLRGA